MRQKKIRARKKNFIDLSPMLDVIFQLVLFFLVTSTFAVNRGIKISLPESSSAENLQRDAVEISLLDDGRIFFNGEEIPRENLGEKLDAWHGEKNAFLSCEKNAGAQKIVEVLDVLRSAEFFSVSLKTAP